MTNLLRGLLPTLWNNFSPVKRAGFHALAKPNVFSASLLPPTTGVSIVQKCGFKVKGNVKRRCRDCYFVMRQQRLYVLCETHPRHKQMSMIKDERNTWILTQATQSKIRPW